MMNCFSNTTATLSEVYDREINELRWLAEVITGDAHTAESCIASARSRADGALYVAPDWRGIWTKRCVAREAVERQRSEIARFTANQSEIARVAANHHRNPLTFTAACDETAFRRLPPAKMCEVLNAFERAALILHVYLGFSVHDCALLVDCHWSLIESACSAAMSRLFAPGTFFPLLPEQRRRSQCSIY